MSANRGTGAFPFARVFSVLFEQPCNFSFDTLLPRARSLSHPAAREFKSISTLLIGPALFSSFL